MGYNQSNQDELRINKMIVDGMFPEAFHDPNVIFYTCNSATGNKNSIASIWKNTLGGFATGYVGKITYEYIMYPKEYISFKKIYSSKMREIDAQIEQDRSEYGFSKSGSLRYPIPSDGAKVRTY